MEEVPDGSGRARHLVLVGDAATPLPIECLACYVSRMLEELGCNATLRWARRWRDARAPRATALERRLATRGGFCDCELFLNVWVPSASSRSQAKPDMAADSMSQACRGSRRGSTQPCRLWAAGRI